METSHAVLAINSDSSSLKFAVYQFDRNSGGLLARGAAEGIGHAEGRLWIRESAENPVLDHRSPFPDHGAATRKILSELNGRKHIRIAAVGHRLVNGGADCEEAQKVTPELLKALGALLPLAPLHIPTELKIIRMMESELPGIPQVVCFDTAFHRRMPPLAQRLPLPRQLWTWGLQRYGFHGLSCEYIVHKIGAAAQDKRMIVAHLGNGSSLTAIRNGHSIETTMGFTPTGGVVMGTRTGDLDPGVLLFLIREKKYDGAMLERLVNRESGLLGVSGTTSDMKTLLEQRTTDPRAQEAVDLFCYAIRKQIGALTAVLGGLDTLVFTGGIGERATPVREEICRGLDYLGIRLDGHRNENHAEVISTPQSACQVLALATNEELMIARHTHRLIWRHP